MLTISAHAAEKGKHMKTDLNYIKKLIKLLDSGNVSEIEIDEEGTKIRLVKTKPEQPPQFISYAPPQMQMPSMMTPAAPAQQIAPVQPKAEEKTETKESASAGSNLIEVKSPIVGTFYRAPSPTADPYVKVGQKIDKGQVLCIIEAMKLMNEIESEVSGKIAKILVDNSQPVEYNQTLFLVDPNG